MAARSFAARLNKLIDVERKVGGKGFSSAGSDTWERVDQIWAEIEDAMPSRADRLDDAMDIKRRPARLRIRYRADITSAMRFVLGDRIMRVVAGPASIWNGTGCEFMVEDYAPAGNGA